LRGVDGVLKKLFFHSGKYRFENSANCRIFEINSVES